MNISQAQYSWSQFESATTTLAVNVIQHLPNYKEAHLVCLSRGGLFVGGLLSYALGIKHVHCVSVSSYKVEHSAEQSNIELLTDFLPTIDKTKLYIFVDDINDTSETYKFIKSKCSENGIKMLFATTLHKKRDSNLTPDFIGEEIPSDAWVVFPWDNVSSKDELRSQTLASAKEDLKQFLKPFSTRMQQNVSFNKKLENIGASVSLEQTTDYVTDEY